MGETGNINRRSMIAGAAAICAATAIPSEVLARRKPRKPNVLFLLSDDLRFDGVGYRNAMVRTPNIDKLAARGARFSNAFISTSICCTSRATIQTGTYARRHGVWDFFTPLPDDLAALTYPRLMRQAGYRTGYVGKYGIGDMKDETKAALEQDFDQSWDFEDYYAPDDTARQWHNNRRVADLAMQFLDATPADTPFCLTLGFKAPHAKDDGDPVMGPYVAEPDMFRLYADDIFTRGELMNEAAFATLPGYIQKSEARRRWQQRFSTDDLWLDSVRKYFALVTGMDRAIGQVLGKLEAAGRLDDTLIVFGSDNGYFLGDYGLEGKWYGYEGSIRVPLVIVPPGGMRPRQIAAQVLNEDFAPTFLAAAGLEIPDTMQGMNLMPLLSGRTPKGWRTDFLYEHYLSKLYDFNKAIESFLPSSEGVRDERYTYLRYPRQSGQNEMLFDRQADPNELKNIARTAGGDVLDRMRNRTDELIAQWGNR